MTTPKIFESEYRFCLILWKNEPISSSQLAKLCKEELGWSRTTTYTVIKRLSDRGVVKNTDSVITSLVSKEEAQISQIDEMLEKTFEGSIPAFIAAFAKREKLSDRDIKEIRKIIGEESFL
ncbi:MAG: BlaI/MecI/CopY family transcriptional regulator [Lachnospiraceae bacterium]|nr:BlaI/MecI/CopY family transcriptional regulator [Lachnospiraceae bacterium]